MSTLQDIVLHNLSTILNFYVPFIHNIAKITIKHYIYPLIVNQVLLIKQQNLTNLLYNHALIFYAFLLLLKKTPATDAVTIMTTAQTVPATAFLLLI